MKCVVKYSYLLEMLVIFAMTASVAVASYISGGSLHSLAVKSDWKVAAWGYSSFGQLGDGSGGTGESFTSVPVEAIGLSGVKAVAAGLIHSLALKSDGAVWAWGDNTYGQLGQGTTSDTNQPINVVGLSSITAIGAAMHSLALKSDGTIWAWGYNGGGQLGNGTGGSEGEYSTVPVQVSGLSGVIAISAGGHSLALKNDGAVWAWGYNNYGQLGDGTTTMRTTPVQVSALSNVVAVAASSGYGHSLAVKNDGTVWAWGYNAGGALGDGTTTNRTTPVQVIGLSNVIDVAAGGSYGHSLALKSDGTVWAWGYNIAGQLGDGTTTDRSTPVQVSGLSGVIGIAAGQYYSLAQKNDGTVWAWGNNNYGQLGDGTTTERHTPVQVSGLSAPTCEADEFGAQGYEPVSGDFDGDGKSDEAVYEEESGYWYVELSSSHATTYQKFGEAGYLPVSGDFDGDGKSDLVVYQESTGYWFMLLSGSSYSFSYLKFGESGYTPVPGDYDGDGKDDVAVYQESTGYWYILLSGSGYSLAWMKFGASGYIPVPGDYDGDGKTDVAVYQNSSTYWYIFNSSTYSLSYAQFGSSGCEPVSGDFDGDGKTDLAVYEDASAYWNIALSASGTLSTMKFGEPGYTPMPGDYDGDGKTDIATYDESTGYWYIQPSSNY